MPAGTYSAEVPLLIGEIWDFVSVVNKWAPLVPGYLEHEILNVNESIWSFKGDLGFVKKEVTLKIEITEWKEPTAVTFNIKGMIDNFAGTGSFLADSIDANTTKITSNLDISAGGAMGPLINTVLTTFVPQLAQQLIVAVAEKIIEVNSEED